MSRGTSAPDDETDLLAAEYVLGTLDAADQATVGREVETDPVLEAAVRAWEDRLAPLNRLVAPITPPPSLWPRIEASAWGGAAAARRVASAPELERQRAGTTRLIHDRNAQRRGLRLWRGATAAGFALAAALAGFAVLRPHAPPPPGPDLVAALLPLGQQSPIFVAQATANGALTVRPVGTPRIAPDRDLELWLLRNGETVPRPLGVLPVAGVHFAAGTLPRGGAKILVSLEPRGGSPTGLPTGPVLYGGAI